MELWLIRHPRPLVAPNTCYGRLDVAPAPDDLQSAAARLAGLLPDAPRLRTSPARRCRELAHRLHHEPAEDHRLHERGFGHWEGQTWDAIDIAVLDAWAADPWDFTPPGGESARMVRTRVAELLAEELALGGTAVWVTHQGVARATAGLLLELSAGEWMTLAMDFAEAWRFVQSGSTWVLEKG